MKPNQLKRSGQHHQAVDATVVAHVGRRMAAGGFEPRTAFVLSGGASLGAGQVGMLQALYELGIAPDVLVGTSVGALNAAFVASRPQTTATAIELGRVWRSLQRKDVFPASVSGVVGGLTGRRDHLVPDRRVRLLVRRHIQFDDLADAAIPLHVVTFDLTEGRELLQARRARPRTLRDHLVQIGLRTRRRRHDATEPADAPQ